MNLITLSEKFNTHDKCIKHLTLVRWGDTITCPRCNSDRITSRSLRLNSSVAQNRKVPLYHCNKCNKDFSVLTGTIFEATKLPLNKWFYMICTICNAKKGVSSLQLSRDLDITPKTAWYCGMRIRCAMLEQAKKLSGIVEMDITYIGGKPRHRYDKTNPNKPIVKGLRGKGTKKIPVVAIVERDGRVVTKMMGHNPTTPELMEMFINHTDIENTELMTDEGSEFKRFKKIVPHQTVNHERKEYARFNKETNQNINTNTVEGFFGMLKNSLKAQFHTVSKKYLPFYLSEFCYKYNIRGKQKLSFDKAIQNSVSVVRQFLNYQPTRNPLKIAYGHEAKKV